jgi:hypothetical protein
LVFMTMRSGTAWCRYLVRSRLVGMILATVTVFVFTACQEYGGRSQRVTLISEPPAAIASVIIYREWLNRSGDRMMVGEDVLERYRVKAGLTPIVVDLPPYEHVFVANWNGHKEFTRFVPKAGLQVKIVKPTSNGPP